MTSVTGSDRKLATGAALVAGFLVGLVVILGYVATQTDDDLRQRTLRWMAALVAVVAVVAVANAVAARALVDRCRGPAPTSRCRSCAHCSRPARRSSGWPCCGRPTRSADLRLAAAPTARGVSSP